VPQPSHQAPAHPLLRAPAPWALLVGAVAFAAFWPALGGAFLSWDDAGYVVDNPHVHELSWSTVRWAFTEFCCNYWAPLTWLSLALDHALWGLDPWGFHLTNHLLHGLNAALLVLVSHRLLLAAGGAAGLEPPRWALPGAVLAAACWALHPLRVESVAWIAERKDVLSAALGLGAVLAWLSHAGGAAGAGAGRHAWRSPAYLAALALFALSMLAKPGLVMLPLGLLVLDWFPLARVRRVGVRALLLEKAPFLAVALAGAAVATAATAPTVVPLRVIGLGIRIPVAFQAVVTYLRLAVAPLDVSPVYFHPWRAEWDAATVLAAVAVTAVSAAAFAARRRWPGGAAAWAFFLLVLAPGLGLFLNGPQALAPRFSYVPGMAPAVLLGGATAAWLARRRPALRLGTGLALLLGLAALSAITVRDLRHWRDDVALWTRVVELDPRSAQALKELAIALTEAERYPEAIEAVDRALALHDPRGHADRHLLLALRAGIHWTLGDEGRAAADLLRAANEAGEPLRREYLRQREELLGR